MNETHTYSKSEEIVNAITHGLGVLLSLVALVFLLIYSIAYGTAWHIVSFTIFGLTMLLMYTCSTMLHSLPQGKAKNVFEILDHSSIYFFIAGSYTPFLFILIDGWLGWLIFSLVWSLAIIGTVFKSFYVKKYMLASTLLYVVMGWLIVIAWKPLVANLHQHGLYLLVAGGLLYTFGSIFYVWRGFKFHHAVWHLFVVAGSAMHFFAVILFLV